MNVASLGRRAGLLVALSAAVLLAACGGSSSDSTVAAGTGAYKEALAYSACMRSHGIPNFPDPDNNGDIKITPGELPGSNAQVNAAETACNRLSPSGQMPAAQQQQQALTMALKYAACMRSHGVSDFPDPATDNGVVHMSLPPGINPNSPQFQAANGACQQYPHPA